MPRRTPVRGPEELSAAIGVIAALTGLGETVRRVPFSCCAFRLDCPCRDRCAVYDALKETPWQLQVGIGPETVVSEYADGHVVRSTG